MHLVFGCCITVSGSLPHCEHTSWPRLLQILGAVLEFLSSLLLQADLRSLVAELCSLSWFDLNQLDFALCSQLLLSWFVFNQLASLFAVQFSTELVLCELVSQLVSFPTGLRAGPLLSLRNGSTTSSRPKPFVGQTSSFRPPKLRWLRTQSLLLYTALDLCLSYSELEHSALQICTSYLLLILRLNCSSHSALDLRAAPTSS
ncbi:hypothetical protein F511_25551 [Dorcoceras hygrometricum]|uniref:Uncharacterized protein n=1 Tax=Dorcoceras hygrometricum TaxID=472368 RepID=A0A2Z7BCU2_9LAMI|nr:hypothetical protein F511_25551 [Dorcoceras hygrometricum]